MQRPEVGRPIVATFLERCRQRSRTVCLRQELEQGRTTIKALESQLTILTDLLLESASECNKLRFRTSCRRQINLDRPGMALALPGSILRLPESPSTASWTACIVSSATPGLQPKKMGATPVSVWSRMQQPSLRSATLGHSSSASGPVLESMDDGTTQLAVRTPQIASVLLAASVTFPEGASSSREAGIAAVAAAPRTPSDEQEGDLVD
ncbi:g1058 [Coccomyxa elongata]